MTHNHHDLSINHFSQSIFLIIFENYVFLNLFWKCFDEEWLSHFDDDVIILTMSHHLNLVFLLDNRVNKLWTKSLLKQESHTMAKRLIEKYQYWNKQIRWVKRILSVDYL